MTTDGASHSSISLRSRVDDIARDESRASRHGDGEGGADVVEEFLERDLLSEGVAEEVSRLHATGDHRQALRLIVESRHERRYP